MDPDDNQIDIYKALYRKYLEDIYKKYYPRHIYKVSNIVTKYGNTLQQLQMLYEKVIRKYKVDANDIRPFIPPKHIEKININAYNTSKNDHDHDNINFKSDKNMLSISSLSQYFLSDELLVNGFIRFNVNKLKIKFPKDIINLCLKWYHIELYWIYIGDKYISNRNECRTDSFPMFQLNPSVNIGNNISIKSCYHSITMQSISKTNIEYMFKLKILKCEDIVSIGVHCNKYTYFYECPNAKNDIIIMIYNPYKSTLQFNHGRQKRTVNNIVGETGLIYQLFVVMSEYGKQSIELLEYNVIHVNDNDIANKHSFAPVPLNYLCIACNKRGDHWIMQCKVH